MKNHLNKHKLNINKKEIFTGKIKEEELENEKWDEYDYLIKILKIKRHNRPEKAQERINKYLCDNIEYFKHLLYQIEEKTLQKITGTINYHHFPADYKIFSFGDDVDRFYTILKGSIKLLRPTTVQKLMTLKDFTEYLVNIRDNENNEIKFRRIQDYNPKVRYRLMTLDYDYNKIPLGREELFIVEEEKEINILAEGDVFGEIKLIKDEKRNETVITKEECDIVSLDRTDFAKLKSIEEQKMINKLTFFRIDYPIFKFWSNTNCLNLLKGLKTEKYEKGDFIYRQNDLPEYIYLIKEGIVESYSNHKFNMYENFIEYIHDGTNSLMNIIDDPLEWNEENISKKIETAYKDLEDLKLKIKLSKYDEEELDKCEIKQDENMDNNKKKLVKEMEKLNNDVKNYLYKANIQKYSAPQIFGYLEAVELKRRFCTLRCYSNTAIISKIPIMTFLLLIPTDKKSIFHLQSIIFEEKKVLMEQIKNNTLAKLTFINMNSLKNKIIKQYNSGKEMKGNNNEFRFTKSLKFRNEQNFGLNSYMLMTKKFSKSIENNGVQDKYKIKKSEIVNMKQKLDKNKFNENKTYFIDNFKKTMINLNTRKLEVIKKLYPKTSKNSDKNSNFSMSVRNYKSNSFQYLEKNSNNINRNQRLLFNMSTDNFTMKNYTKINFSKKGYNRNDKNIFVKNKLSLPSIIKSNS
jgi:CRP-like cAMP-binding protein